MTSSGDAHQKALAYMDRHEKGERAEMISTIMLWLINVTPAEICATYGIPYEEGVDRWDTMSGGYVKEKYKKALKNPVAWYLDLDLGNRRRLIKLALKEA